MESDQLENAPSPQLWPPCGPVKCLADIEALERVSLDERIQEWDINVWMRAGCMANPDKIALTFYRNGDPAEEPERMRYHELLQRVNRTANFFSQQGVTASDTVLFLLPTILDTYVVLQAAMATGIACSVNWLLKPAYVAELIRTSRALVVVALGPTPGYGIWETIEAIRPEIPADVKLFSVAGPGGTVLPDSDLALLSAGQRADRLVFASHRGPDDLVAYVHSGGTTGAPKLVKLTSRGFVHKCWTLVMTMAHQRSDVLLSDMPMFHVAGFLSCGVLPIVLGCSIVIPTPMGARDKAFVANYWKFTERHRVTFMHAVPATLSLLAQNPPRGEDISSLRDYATTGSTALPIAVAQTIERTIGIRLVATYGATEFTQNVTQGPRNGDPRFGSAGIRNPYTEIRIAHLDGQGNVTRVCGPDEIGCVLVRSPGSTPGYVDAVQDRSVLMGEGWINNGDLGRLDQEGYLWITGRAKDLIIRSGHNIDPGVIEGALLSHPAIFMAAAVGMPDAYAGEVPVGYVQLKPDVEATVEELLVHVKSTVADPVAVPRILTILPELPLTDVRKINKNALREDAARRTLSSLLAAVLPEGVLSGLEIASHPTHGTQLRLRLVAPRSPTERTSLAAAVADSLRPFTIFHEVFWLE